MLETAIRNQPTAESSSLKSKPTSIPPATATESVTTKETNTRRMSQIVVTPSQILCGSLDNNLLSASNGTGTTTPLYEETDGISNNLEAKNCKSAELPPFSFSKKPIEDKRNFSDKIMSNITTSFGKKNPPRQSQFDKSHHKLPKHIELDDYDQQIRFPQMKTNNYVYNPINNSNESFEMATAAAAVKEEEEAKVLIKDVKDYAVDEGYKPAFFDLNQPIRRYSTPNKVTLNDEIRLLEEYTRNNCIYENNKLQSLTTSNSTQQEGSLSSMQGNSSARLKNQVSFPKLYHKDSKQKLNQVYQMKKPLLTPAVLRAEPQPIQEQCQYLPPQEVIHPQPCWPKSQSTQPQNAKAFTSKFTIFTVEQQALNIGIEPSHHHWQPNNATKACMSCLRPFYSSLVTMIYDVPKRHHCRFCGLVFCKSCLNPTQTSNTPTTGSSSTASLVATINSQQTSTVATMKPIIDKNANFIIPVTTATSTNLASLPRFKTCPKCTTLYSVLVAEISNPENVTNLLDRVERDSSIVNTPYVVVENPYIQDGKMFGCDTTTFNFKRLSICSPKNGGIGTESNDVCTESERRISVAGDMPTDWTWSSF
ncbi:hypothetical protein CANMA_002384 [Candida margitis]|uniref:uncharacterized protein n=1 Tax=Candida margitis TaxID=1775924 RepID=UPI002225F403|nr:uncharacterized protein CANMA_002384 [Candida margitis]KAI5968393.1 hypothetical protein CANMA_002384 [Candida margitis]